jgi:hypothetical protein
MRITCLVKDVLPGADSGLGASLVVVNGTLFFGAYDASNSQEL